MTVTQELVAEFIASHLPHLRGQDVAQLSLSDFSTWQVGPDYILRVAFGEDGGRITARSASSVATPACTGTP